MKLCDRRVPIKLKKKKIIRLSYIYDQLCFMVLNVGSLRSSIFIKMNIVEKRMLKWISGNTQKDRIRNEIIHPKMGVALIDAKMRELLKMI